MDTNETPTCSGSLERECPLHGEHEWPDPMPTVPEEMKRLRAENAALKRRLLWIAHEDDSDAQVFDEEEGC